MIDQDIARGSNSNRLKVACKSGQDLRCNMGRLNRGHNQQHFWESKPMGNLAWIKMEQEYQAVALSLSMSLSF